VKKPKAKWVKPEVLADIEYRAITEDGTHATWIVQGCARGFNEKLVAIWSFPHPRVTGIARIRAD
jgi:hypothetical protein